MPGARQRILDVARDLLERDGLDSVPIEAIRERAEVSNGSFFHHFPTRAALVGELYLDGLRRYHAHIEEAIASDPTAAVGVAAAIHAHLDWVVLQRSLSRLLEERVALGEVDQRRRTEENERFAAVLDRWRRSLIESDQIVPMDNDLFVALIVGPARIVSRNWLLGHRATPPSSYADDLVAAAIRALGAARPTGAHQPPPRPSRPGPSRARRRSR